MDINADLTKVSEERFCVECLVPLFRAMDFWEVEHYHGGPNRHRDVEPDAMGEWENFTVVAKRGKINARASGKGSAGRVATQVQQCFADPFVDKSTGEQRIVY